MEIRVKNISRDEKRILKRIGIEIQKDRKERVYLLYLPQTISLVKIFKNIYYLKNFDGMNLGYVWSPFNSEGGTITLNLLNISTQDMKKR